MMRPEETVPLTHQQVVHHYHGQNDQSQNKGFGKLVDTILPIAVVALVGVVWNQSISMAKMEVALNALVKEVADLRTSR